MFVLYNYRIVTFNFVLHLSLDKICTIILARDKNYEKGICLHVIVKVGMSYMQYCIVR